MNKLKLSLAMLLWGSIGVFTRYIHVSPILLAFLRALIAIPLLYVFHKLQKSQNRYTVRKLLPFILSGSILGLAWFCLFTAFKNTSISIAILVYNMCPVYVLILAPIMLKEQLRKTQVITVIMAFLGLVVIVGSAINAVDFSSLGIGFAIISGMLYASLVVINRKTKTDFDSSTITLVQMVSAALTLLPFVIIEGQLKFVNKPDSLSILLILILGLVHTGLAYHLYFSGYKKLSAVTIVSFSYLEPLFSIILSVVVLGEQITVNQIIGGFLILGSTYIGEYVGKPRPSDFAGTKDSQI